MSNTQYAFLKADAVPGRAVLQAWIDELGFNLNLDPELDLVQDRGFSPCSLNEVADVGFELWPEPTADVAAGSDELIAIAGDNNFCIVMSWGGSLKDCAAAMIVCCALAKHCDAVVSYEGDEPESFSQLLESTHQVLEDVRKEA